MTVFFRSAPTEVRQVSDPGWARGDSARAGSGSLKSDLSLLPVYAAVRLLSDGLSTLPIHAHSGEGDARVPLALPRVIGDPHPVLDREAWLGQLTASLLLRGNAYGLVTARDSLVQPDQVVWLHPDKVTVDEAKTRVRYMYGQKELPFSDVIHIQGITLPGSVVGVSPIAAAKMAIDSGQSLQKFSRDWFRGKAIPSAIFKNTSKTLTAQQAETLSERFKSKLRAGEPLIYGSDWDYQSLTMSAEDAGFLTASRATATQIATIYGVPPEMIGGDTGSSMTYSTVEMNGLNFVTWGLRPWLVRIENKFSRRLMPAGAYVRFKPDALIRADTKARAEVYKINREIGLRNIDELRALEDLPPLPNGAGADYAPLRATPTPPKEIA